jgi:hypothetical protein
MPSGLPRLMRSYFMAAENVTAEGSATQGYSYSCHITEQRMLRMLYRLIKQEG